MKFIKNLKWSQPKTDYFKVINSIEDKTSVNKSAEV